MGKQSTKSIPVSSSKPAKKIVFNDDGADASELAVASTPTPVQDTVNDDNVTDEEDSDDEPEVVGVQAGRKEAEDEASRAER